MINKVNELAASALLTVIDIAEEVEGFLSWARHAEQEGGLTFTYIAVMITILAVVAIAIFALAELSQIYALEREHEEQYVPLQAVVIARVVLALLAARAVSPLGLTCLIPLAMLAAYMLTYISLFLVSSSPARPSQLFEQ